MKTPQEQAEERYPGKGWDASREGYAACIVERVEPLKAMAAEGLRLLELMHIDNPNTLSKEDCPICQHTSRLRKSTDVADRMKPEEMIQQLVNALDHLIPSTRDDEYVHDPYCPGRNNLQCDCHIAAMILAKESFGITPQSK